MSSVPRERSLIERAGVRAGVRVARLRLRGRMQRAFGAIGALACIHAADAMPIADDVGPALAPASVGVQPASSALAQAIAYENGEGVPKDLRRAAALYCDAARDGNADAQYGLGWMYANGRGMPRDDALAASLLALAAAAGQPDAPKALRYLGSERGHLPDCMRPAEPDNVDPFARDNVASDPFATLPPWKKQIADLVESLAPTYAVNPRLALAVITVESNFEPRARSDKDARGLMQLVAGTADRFRVADRYDIRENVRGGLAYLQWLLAYYQGQVPLAAAAYNAGEGAVDKYRGIPPYAETRAYVRRVLALFPGETHPYDPSIAEPSPILAGPVAGTL